MPQPDIAVKLLNILVSEWDPSKTLKVLPEIGSGFFDGQGGSYQVLVENTPNEDAIGTSGVHGINSSGGNNQLYRGLTFINCMAERDDGLLDPDQITDAFVKEVQRIVRKHMNTVAGYDYISFLGYNRIPPQHGVRPLMVSRSCRIGFQWRIED